MEEISAELEVKPNAGNAARVEFAEAGESARPQQPRGSKDLHRGGEGTEVIRLGGDARDALDRAVESDRDRASVASS